MMGLRGLREMMVPMTLRSSEGLRGRSLREFGDCESEAGINTCRSVSLCRWCLCCVASGLLLTFCLLEVSLQLSRSSCLSVFVSCFNFRYIYVNNGHILIYFTYGGCSQVLHRGS